MNPISLVLTPIHQHTNRHSSNNNNTHRCNNYNSDTIDKRTVLTISYYPSKQEDQQESLTLGRNEITSINDPLLSRQLCCIYFQNLPSSTHDTTDTTLTNPIHNLKSKRKSNDKDADKNIHNITPRLKVMTTKNHNIHINGIQLLENFITLQSGDLISLNKDMYTYHISYNNPNITTATTSSLSSSSTLIDNTTKRIKSEEDENQIIYSFDDDDDQQLKSSQDTQISQPSTTSPTNTPPLPKISRVEKIAKKHLYDDLTCSICMEILVKTHVLHPCGHLFCQSCCSSSKITIGSSCPNCRSIVKYSSHLPQYDNFIWNIIISGCFVHSDTHNNLQDHLEDENNEYQIENVQEDIKVFLTRCGKELNTLPPEEYDCIMKHYYPKEYSVLNDERRVHSHPTRLKRKAESSNSSSIEIIDSPLLSNNNNSNINSIENYYPRRNRRNAPPTGNNPYSSMFRSTRNNHVRSHQDEGNGSRDDPICL